MTAAMSAAHNEASVKASTVVEHLERAGQTSLGEKQDISPAEVRAILKLAA